MSNKLSIISDLQEATAERTSGGFSGTRIPFMKVPKGKTRLLFLSDLESEDSTPDIRFYNYYPIPGRNGIELNGSITYEVYHKAGDPILDIFTQAKAKEGKKVNPQNFAKKGFAYVVNLTFLKAVNFYLERGKKPTSKEFGGDLTETTAAKAYIDQYDKLLEKHEEYRKSQIEAGEDDPGDFVLHGIFMYNFPFSITKAIATHIENLMNDEVEPEDISLREHVFALNKDGEGMNTSYSFTPDFPAEDVDPALTAPAERFVESNELSDFEGLLERRRNKPEDEDLEAEYRVSNVPNEQAASGW